MIASKLKIDTRWNGRPGQAVGIVRRTASVRKKVTAMQCRCGNTINNVPEHLRDLAEWICQKCTNTAPKAQSMSFDASEVQIKKPAQRGRPRKAA